MPLFSCSGKAKEGLVGLIPGRLLPGKAGTALGRGQAIAVYGLTAPMACPQSLPQALSAAGSGPSGSWEGTWDL